MTNPPTPTMDRWSEMDAQIVADTMAEMQGQIEKLTGARHSMYDPAVAIARQFITSARSVGGDVVELREALGFYADPSRYNGPNQSMRRYEADRFTPEDMPYRMDVTRDGGKIARAALSRIEAGGGSLPAAAQPFVPTEQAAGAVLDDLRAELKAVEYQPGDHPIVPFKHAAFVKAVQRIVDQAAVSPGEQAGIGAADEPKDIPHPAKSDGRTGGA